MDSLIKQVILKVAERCNLNCSYCYMYQHADQTYRSRPRFMSEAVYLRTLVMLRNYCDGHDSQIQLSFHGGEPTLIGRERFERWVGLAGAALGDRLGGVSVQTNGVLIDEAWVAMLERNRVSVGLSMDGPARIHDRERVDFAGRGSHARVMETLRLFRRRELPFTVLCVINPNVSGLEVYRFFRSARVTNLDFLIPDVTHDSVHQLRPDPRATPVADYLIPIFDAWLEQDDPEMKIRIFWGILRRMLGGDGITDGFGNPTLKYLVVESDGAIEGNDVLKVCEEGLAQTGLNVLEDSFDDLRRTGGVVARMVYEGLPLSSRCRRCPEVSICGGGYHPHRYSRDRGFDNPSVWCADILKLLAHIRRQCGLPLPDQHA